MGGRRHNWSTNSLETQKKKLQTKVKKKFNRLIIVSALRKYRFSCQYSKNLLQMVNYPIHDPINLNFLPFLQLSEEKHRLLEYVSV